MTNKQVNHINVEQQINDRNAKEGPELCVACVCKRDDIKCCDKCKSHWESDIWLKVWRSWRISHMILWRKIGTDWAQRLVVISDFIGILSSKKHKEILLEEFPDNMKQAFLIFNNNKQLKPSSQPPIIQALDSRDKSLM